MQIKLKKQVFKFAIIFLVISILIGCQSKKITIGRINIEVPNDWVVENIKCLDCIEMGKIYANSDTLYFELSPYLKPIIEPNYELIPLSVKNEFLLFNQDTTNVIFISHHNPLKVDIDKFRKQNVDFEIINGFEIKKIYPRKNNIGITGIYIDSVGQMNSIGKIKFKMYGVALSEKTTKELFYAVENLTQSGL